MIELIIFGMDGILVSYGNQPYKNSWEAVAFSLGLDEKMRKIRNNMVLDLDSYLECCEKCARLFKGGSVERVEKEIFPLSYSRGVFEAIRKLKKDYVVGVVTSGLDIVANRVREDLGLDFVRANHLVARDGRFTGDVVVDVNPWAKEEAIVEIAREYNVDRTQICFVGKNLSDISAMKFVFSAIAFDPEDPRVLDFAAGMTDNFESIPQLISFYEKILSFAEEHNVPLDKRTRL